MAEKVLVETYRKFKIYRKVAGDRRPCFWGEYKVYEEGMTHAVITDPFSSIQEVKAEILDYWEWRR